MSSGQPREARGSGASLDLARGGSRGGVAGLADGAEECITSVLDGLGGVEVGS